MIIRAREGRPVFVWCDYENDSVALSNDDIMKNQAKVYVDLNDIPDLIEELQRSISLLIKPGERENDKP